jgi:DNA-binding LacI/PurR family transcriptional regulator
MQAAEELGYRPHMAARNLAMGRTGLVALILNDPQILVGSTLFSGLVAAIVTRLENDFNVVVKLPADDASRRALGDRIRPVWYDGAIVVGHRSEDPLLRQLASHAVPTVVLGRPLGTASVSFVDVDNFEGGRLAGVHLASAGRRHMALLAGPSNTSWGIDRTEGFRTGLDEHGCALPPDRITELELTSGSHYHRTLELLEAEPDVDGLFIASETFLPAALAALASQHRRISDDVGLVCYDDGPALKFHNPPITAVRQPIDEIGNALAEMLVDTIDRPSQRRSLILQPELIRPGATV